MENKAAQIEEAGDNPLTQGGLDICNNEIKEKENELQLIKVQDKPGREKKPSKVDKRIKCIDVFRGLTIALMLIMENPGNPDHVSSQLRHAIWDGFTLADIAFPFFIFIAGVVIPIAIKKRRDAGDSKLELYIHILYRSTVIFLTGLFINGFPSFDLSTIRIPGPLQRIAVVYLIASILAMETNILIESIVALSTLILYFIIMKYVKVPGFGPGILAQDGNLAQYIDLQFLKGHMYTEAWDPEGIMGILPSVATILSGVIGGQILISDKESKSRKAIYLLVIGAACIIASSLFSNWFPINKNLWSSSYVFYTSGISFIVLGICFLITDVIGYSSVFKPFIILGSSALFIYVGFEIVRRTLWLIMIPDAASEVSIPLYLWICNHLITPWAGDVNDSYYFSIVYTLLWVVIVRAYRGRQYFANK